MPTPEPPAPTLRPPAGPSPPDAPVPGPPAPDRLAARARLRRRARRVALRLVLVVGAAAVVTIAVASFLLDWATGTGVDTGVIAVAPFRVRATDDAARGGPGDARRLLREGMLDLLAARLTGEDGPRATDPRALLAQWRRVAASDTADLPRERAREVARTLGAGRLLLGEVSGTADSLVLDAAVLAVEDGRTVATERLTGRADSLPALVDRLAVRLLADEGARRGAALAAGTSLTARATGSAPALRAYLAAQALTRRGRLREGVESYERALGADSTFALAAVGLASAATWLDDSLRLARGVRLAWRERARLSRQDRALLEAKTGPRWPAVPTLAELVSAKERYARAAPERAEAWAEAGDGLFHLGPAVGAADAHARAAAAFRRALALDPALAPALEHLTLLAAREGDAARASQLADDALALRVPAARLPLLRWRVAALRDDRATLDSLARAGGTVAWPVVRLAALLASEDAAAPAAAARLLAARVAAPGNGIGPADPPASSMLLPGTDATPPGHGPAGPSGADAALGVASATLGDLRLMHDLAVNRGLAIETERALDRMQARNAPLARRIRATDALYGDGDTLTASASVRVLAGRTERPPTGPADQLAHLADLCVVALWRVERGDPRARERTVRPVLAWLRDPAATPPTPDSLAMASAARAQAAREAAAATARRRRRRPRVARTPAADSAALLRAAQWRDARSPMARDEALGCATLLDAAAAAGRKVDLRRPADRLDSLLRVAPPGSLTDDAGRFVLARLLVRQGDRRGALAVLRRRPYLHGPPGYVARALREEADLAERTRDRSGAAVAWRRYATLRASADPPLRPEVARAWSEVRRLELR